MPPAFICSTKNIQLLYNSAPLALPLSYVSNSISPKFTFLLPDAVYFSASNLLSAALYTIEEVFNFISSSTSNSPKL